MSEDAGRYVLWRCRDCAGLFAYPSSNEPNFCPYCRSNAVRPSALKAQDVAGDRESSI
jgi:predicted Zn-ribbon and HTH transcriptional regulator